jgi:lipoprotein-releasing system ATP-binding protein
MADAAPLLQVEGVVKAYGEEVKTLALRGVSLTLAAGEFVALIGPSGSGKSTLLHIIGLLDRPTEGRVTIGGVDPAALDEPALAALRGRSLGFVFQFHHLLPAFSALENVMLPAWGDEGRPTPASRAQATELLKAVGLGDRLDARPTALSGGQKQRVAVARALSRSAPLVLADEPTGNLDTQTSDEVFALMRQFNLTRGVTFLIVTHDPRIAERCDRVISVVDGVIASDARTPAAQAAMLAAPPTTNRT